MAALDFPASSSSPWTDPNGNVWVWNGTGWAQKIPYPGSAAEVLNTVIPSLSVPGGQTGSDIGDVITLDRGTWLNAASFIDNWFMADGAGVETALSVTGLSYTRSSADAGQTIYAKITAVGAYGGNSAPVQTNSIGKRKLTFAATGGFQTWTVPTGVYSIDLKMWGASDSNGERAWGGFSKGTLAVNPGDQFQVIVGMNSVAFGGVSHSGSGYHAGGMSGLFSGHGSITYSSGTDQARAIMIAGGAGGSSKVWPNGGCGGDGGGETGWYGFGTHANNGSCGDYPSTNWNWTSRCYGTQTGGNGTVMQGGGGSHCSWWYGGGGGGYFGGCGGSCSGGCHSAGGGGGSGYIGNTVHPQPSLTNAFTYRGSDIEPFTDSDHITGVGQRQEGGLGDGLVIMYF